MGASLERLLRRSVMASADIVVCLVSALVSIYMVDSSLAFYHTRFWGIVTLILLQTCLMALFKVYRIRLVDSSLELLVRGVGSLVVSGILILVIVLTQIKDFTYSFRLVASYWTNTVLFLMGYRILYRLVNTYHFRGSDRYPKAVVYGAGEIGSQLARMYFKQKLQLSIVGFIDDNPLKIHTMVQGIQVYGTIEQLPETLSETKASALIIAITDLSSERMKQTLDIASKAGVEVKIVPSLFEMQEGRKSFADLRSINYNDLLGRSPITIDREPIEQMVCGKRVLVTGAGGSIGSEISRQLLMYKPEQLLLFDIDETELHDLALRLHGYKAEFSHAIVPIVGDVRNADKVEWTFATYQPELVFHAAAYKHVPMMEYYPEEAIVTNILGTQTVFSTAVRHHAKKCILISTDKAVNPTNVMGASKRVAELVASRLTTSETEIVCVRFGNVLGSRGSMLPLFLEQIREGLPITVTDKRIIRYFMTIPEAVSLVFLAGAMARGGEVMVLDMGEQVNIYEFANRLVKYFGDGRSQVVITGLRPGEKLYEEKLSNKDTTIPTGNPKVFKAKVNGNLAGAELDRLIDRFRTTSPETMVETLRTLVPEFSYQGPVHN
jgi:FlaA1/EpsC-like NDP-sugar epimerase